jgi:hypothetical protein
VLDRFRVFLDSPLDPRAGRAMLVFAGAVLLGFAALFVLGASETEQRAVSREDAAAVIAPSSPGQAPVEGNATKVERGRRVRRQDPQDEKGSAAARRAAISLRSHRALQHLPYRDGELTIRLIGARRGRAVLRVSALAVAAARKGWRAFLRRYRDDGRAYLPRFQSLGGHRG